MPRPQARYVLNPGSFNVIYGEPERAAIAAMVEVLGSVSGADDVKANPELLRDVEVIFSGWGAPKLDAGLLAHAPRLRIVFYGAGSIKGVVSDAFWDRGITICSAWGANGVPVAEFTEAQIVLSLKRAWAMAFDGRARQAWPRRQEVPGAFGTTVGLVSLGMIGRLVARRLQSHDLEVLAYDPFVTQAQADADGLRVRMVTLDELFAASDVVSLHAPNLPSTRHLIGRAQLGAMKPGATLINTARGAIIDEAALLAVLQARPDVMALLDVTDPEPPVAGSPFYTLPNVVLTPHIAGSMAGECRRMGQYMIDECRRWLAGEPLRWSVSRERAPFLA